MEIKYLKQLAGIRKIGILENVGLNETEICRMERDHGIRFPSAYKEFLYLAGKQRCIMSSWEPAVLNIEEVNGETREGLSELGVELKPFWAFIGTGEAEQFKFFYLDEGEDPPVYYFFDMKHAATEEHEEGYVIKVANSFSQFINEEIELALKYRR